MEDFVIRAPRGARKNRKRVGRGSGSGHGGTSGKGNKGQKARSGGGVRVGFEGGQMPLFRRLPRRGFSNYRFKENCAVVNVGALEDRCASGETVSPERLVELGLLKNLALPVKILGNGKLSKRIEVRAHRFSQAAREKIEAAGGSVIIQVDSRAGAATEKG
jgi:large subunit ribosomal protein L15